MTTDLVNRLEGYVSKVYDAKYAVIKKSEYEKWIDNKIKMRQKLERFGIKV